MLFKYVGKVYMYVGAVIMLVIYHRMLLPLSIHLNKLLNQIVLKQRVPLLGWK